MRTSRLVIGVFAGILFTFSIGATQLTNIPTKAAQVVAAPQSSSVLIADGGDPLPRPHKLVA